MKEQLECGERKKEREREREIEGGKKRSTTVICVNVLSIEPVGVALMPEKNFFFFLIV